jgi:signal transduction histidine kinase
MNNNAQQFHYLVKDSLGNIIDSNLPASCLMCSDACGTESEIVTTCGLSGKRRRGFRASMNGSVFLCAASEDYLKSNKVFKRELDLFTRSIAWLLQIKDEVQKKEASRAARLFHNLISLNAHAIQDLYSMIPQEDLSNYSGFPSQKEMIKQRLISSPDVAATLFLRALKNESAVKNELSVFQKLYDPSPILRKLAHPIHKVILNVGNLFFQDLADNNITILISPSAVKLIVDYESIQVALYHLFDNACKYAAPSSEIKVNFVQNSNFFSIHLEMTSLYIAPEERSKIFEDGFSGHQPRNVQKAGKGLGMGLIRDLLRLNEGEIEVRCGEPIPKIRFFALDERTYAFNTFVVRFPSKLMTNAQSASAKSPSRKRRL